MNIPTEADQVTRPWGSGNSLRQCAVSPSLAPLAHERTRESLLIRGPALPSAVRKLLTADGKAGPRMKKTIRLCSGSHLLTINRVFRHAAQHLD